jgi:predicted nucleotidyltransferase
VTLATLLARTIAQLERAGIPYMVTGAIASTFHGEPRATRDIDVVIDPTQDALDQLVVALVADRWYVDRGAAADALRDRSQFNAIGPDATKVDFIIRKNRPFSAAEFGRRERVELLGVEGDIVSVEDLIVAKLEWAAASDSDRQLRDVAGMLAIGAGSIDRAYISTWAEQLGVSDVWQRVSREVDGPA